MIIFFKKLEKKVKGSYSRGHVFDNRLYISSNQLRRQPVDLVKDKIHLMVDVERANKIQEEMGSQVTIRAIL